ncbi:MAG TPA: CAP domain-containing protein [Candidatus Angelobacter sp.]|nr:CAP domain-containing protein [Candidatus Angelobacter sp.]
MNGIRIAIAVQALALMGVAQAPAVPTPPPEQQLFNLLNIERENAGVQDLIWEPKLAQAAQAHALKLADHQELSHRFWGEPELDQRVGATGTRFNAVAENVALANTVEEAHLALMNSPGHRANIMNPKYNAVGIAVEQRGASLYVTQDFARVLPAYSEQQFREGVVAAFNRLRRTHRSGPVAVRLDSMLDHQACSGKMDPTLVLQGVMGATRATVFTATQPDELPRTMDQAAADVGVRRMNIGVCFRPDVNGGFSRFWVVAAFFSSN